MADAKITALTENTTPLTTDILPMVDDPTGTPVTQKITLGNIKTLMSASPTLVTPALGTPASGVMTNVSGTAANLTAGHVTTNANLTGNVTSSGNATTIASYRTNRQNNGSNITETVAKVQTGWVAGQGVGNTAVSFTITFPVAFTNVPIVTCTFGGDTAGVTSTLGSGGANVSAAYAQARSLTTTTFSLTVTGSGTWSTSNTVYVHWIAIGT